MYNKNIYGGYVDFINKAMSSQDIQQLASDYSKISGITFSTKLNEQTNEQELPIPHESDLGVDGLARLLNISYVAKPIIGDHPDFLNLRNQPMGTLEKHYIVSMFIDVKGSTNLYKKYSATHIYFITQMIILAGTHTCSLFGGHILRLQGDGISVYFGGKNVTKEKAVESAINAASFFSYFMRFELKQIFETYDIENIYSRIGIDFGDDEDVNWAIFGGNRCTELTTVSLHTSLAAKMQAHADSNGIMIGDNVKNRLNGKGIYCDLIRDNFGNVDTKKRYIYEDANKKFHYTQSKYNWQSYLKNTFHFVKSDEKGGLYIDYEGQSNEKEKKRIDELANQMALINSGNIAINAKGNFVAPNLGLQIKPNNYYFDGEKL
jgi:adenylate cyclase